MNKISLSAYGHVWQKQNLTTLKDRAGLYDLYKCECGLKVKVRNLKDGEIVGAVTAKKYDIITNCPKRGKVRRVQITICNAHGEQFKALTPNSIHEVVDPPHGKDESRGVWVMGKTEPVLVLFNEFIPA